jgi:excisionase family DNA binding protein
MEAKQPTTDQPLLLDVAEVAHLLGIKERLCWQLIGSGEIRSLKLGGRRKVPRDEVRRIVASVRGE